MSRSSIFVLFVDADSLWSLAGGHLLALAIAAYYYFYFINTTPGNT